MYSSRNDLHWHGYHVSLYSSLSDRSEHLLEEAIIKARIGDFSSAFQIFTADLVHDESKPVVAIEFAEALISQGNWKEARRVLKKALRAAGLQEQAEVHLMKLSLGLTEIIAKGDLRIAQEETEYMRAWLWGVPVEEYTDVMVSIIRRYCATEAFIALTTRTSDVHVVGGIPSPAAPGASPWQGLTDLRESLFRQGRVREASGLLATECAKKPLDQRPATIQAYLDAYKCIETRFSAVPVLLRFQGEGRLAMARVWLGAGETRRANAELEEAAALFGRYLKSQVVRERALTMPFLQVQHVRLGLVSEEELQTRWTGISEFIKAAEKAKHFALLSRAYRDAAEIAGELLAQGSACHRSEFLELHKKREDCQTKMGDLYSLIEDHSALVLHGMSHEADLRMALEWYDGFERMHPGFCLPSSMYDKERLKLLAYGTFLGDGVKAELAQREMNKWEPGTLSPNSLEESDMQEWFSEKHHKAPADSPDGGVRVPRTVDALSILLSWIKRDHANGILDLSELPPVTAIGAKRDQLPDIKGGCVVEPPPRSGHDWSSMTVNCLRTAIFGPSGEPVGDEPWKATLSAITTWLQRAPSVSDAGAQRMNVSLHELRSWSLTESANPVHGPDPELFRRTELALAELKHCVDIFPTLVPLVRYATGNKLSIWLWRMARYRFEMTRLSGEPSGSEINRHNFTEAYRLYKRAAEEQRNRGDLAMARLHCDIAIAIWAGRMNGAAETPDCNIRIALDHLRDADVIMRDVRHGLNLASGCDTPIATLQGIEDFGISFRSWELGELAVQIIHSTKSHDAGVELWDWVQKAKARALANLLGSRIPRMVLADIDIESKKLLDDEMEILDHIQTSNYQERFYLRMRLQQLHVQMRGRNDKLDAMMDLRDGVPITSRGLTDFISSAGLGKAVKFVDWFHAPSLGPDGGKTDLFLVVAKQRANPGPGESGVDISTSPLSIRLDLVRSWVQDHLTEGIQSLGDEDSYDLLKPLGKLVEPLAKETEAEDLLIFCPTNVLRMLPLHALTINDTRTGKDMILIRRNPIVYCHSLSVLRYCHFSAQQKEKDPPIKPPGVAIFADPGNSGMLQWGRNVAKILGRQFNVTPAIGEAATKAAFVKKSAGSRLIHFHGHCSFIEDRPLQHRIELCGPDPPVRYDITAGEVFDLAIPKGSHVTLIACQSGNTQVVPGDEAQGLVPAFLYSGASSAVSTLWNAIDEAGAKFAKKFYGTQRGGTLTDLARAHQEAVLELFEDTELVGNRFTGELERRYWNMEERVIPLYYWGAFVFHGWWRFGVSGAAE
ncbi:MAG: hypothetical protein M1840_002025 [Geoglossum simile]|nr:MAG: hypothetical protein M1840_002025 [Geoglossum simile]